MTNVKIYKLREWNCEIDATLERFMYNEDKYIAYLEKYKNKLNLELLKEYLIKEEYSDAFICVHEIKGIVGNLGLTPLFNTASDLTEILRNKDYSKALDAYEKLLKTYIEFRGILETIQ